MIYDYNKYSLNYTFDYNLEEKENIKNKLNGQSLSINEIRQIALWKYNRIINIDDEILQNLTNILSEKDITVSCSLVKNIIAELLKSQGVGMPLASTILKFLRPDIFPIIDVRAYRALFDKKKRNFKYEDYENYCNKIYEIKEKTGIRLSDIDEKLYEFDKEYNGKI